MKKYKAVGASYYDPWAAYPYYAEPLRYCTMKRKAFSAEDSAGRKLRGDRNDSKIIIHIIYLLYV